MHTVADVFEPEIQMVQTDQYGFTVDLIDVETVCIALISSWLAKKLHVP